MKHSPEFVKQINDLIKIRKNPVLVLNLAEVSSTYLFHLHAILKGKSFKKLDVILQTLGGDIDAAFQIIKLIRKVADELNIIVPLYAKSAGTLICLAADKILLTDLSELGPLDTQIREEQDGNAPSYNSALNGFKALEQVQAHTLETLDIATKLIISRSGMKIAEAIQLATEFSGQTSGTLYGQLNPKKIGEYARALEIGEKYGIMTLTRYMGWSDDKAEYTVKMLVKQYPSHGFIIDLEELQLLGLPAEEIETNSAEILFSLRVLLLKTKNTTIELFEPQQEPKIKGKKEEIETGKKKAIEQKLD